MNTVALIGNPNCGKTTLFNALTGAHQRIGNWPGVTVEYKSGICTVAGQRIEVVDLPGVYSLTTANLASALDAKIASDYILSGAAQVYVNVLDAGNLERNLYLTAQLIELRVPLIVAVNMLDAAKQRGLNIDLSALQAKLGCPVIGLQARQGKGINELQAALIEPAVIPPYSLIYPHALTTAIDTLMQQGRQAGQALNPALCMRLLEDDAIALAACDNTLQQQVQVLQTAIAAELGEEVDILIADVRYTWAKEVISATCHKAVTTKTPLTALIDNIVLHRWLGMPVFLFIMYLMFVFAINIGGAFQDFFTLSSDAVFVQGLSQWLLNHQCPAWLIALLASGAGKGISTTVSFIPVLGAMYLFLAFLEDSGYMARAAFVMDRAMRWVGLPGKSFVPLLVGFGCNVPAIMAARTLEQPQERILTILMTPFMSCSARLAIYTVFVTAFFPTGGQNIVFLLYLTGIIAAIGTALLLRHTWLKGETSTLVMELPVYHLPAMRSLLLQAWHRLKSFIIRAGKLIIPLCMLLGVLNTVTLKNSFSASAADAQSLLSVIGRTVTPLFVPMGIERDNWPAAVGLLTGIMAKEVVIGTLNTLYTQDAHLVLTPSTPGTIQTGLQAARQSIADNFRGLAQAFYNPLLASMKPQNVSTGVFGQMYQRFDGKAGAFAYLLFILLYLPCISTIAAMARELNKTWAAFAIIWATSLAYGVATGFYQIATFARHPVYSSLWLAGLLLSLTLAISLLRIVAGIRR